MHGNIPSPSEASGVLLTINIDSGEFPDANDQFVFYAKGFINVPEPASVMLGMLSLGALALRRRRVA